MKDFGEAVTGTLIVAAAVLLMLGMFAAGTATGRGAVNADLKARGLKEYDKQTGQLIWTEKAGGEKGGDK